MTWQIPFTQYILPNGRQKQIEFTTDDEDVFSKSLQLLGAGYSFSVEVLTTGQVSACIVDDQEEEDAVVKICNNSEELTHNINAMILAFHIGSNRNDSTTTTPTTTATHQLDIE
jgi:hypothetical protein